MENLIDIKEIVFQQLEILDAETDTPLSVFIDYDDDDDDDLPRFYEVEETIKIEPNDIDLLTGAGSVIPSGITDFGNLSDPNLSDYWSIEFDETGTVTVQILREEPDFNSALWIVEGVVNDPNSQFGSEIDFGDPGVVAAIASTGGNPSIDITGQEGDIFTLIVTNFLSGSNTGGDGAFDYTLTIS